MSPIPFIRDISWMKTSASTFSLDEWQRKDGKSDGEQQKPTGEKKPATVVLCWFLLPCGNSLLLLYTNTNEADQCLILLNIEKYLFKIFCHSEKTVDWHLLSLCSVSDVTVEKVCFMCQDSVPFLEQSRCAGLQWPLYFYHDVFLLLHILIQMHKKYLLWKIRKWWENGEKMVRMLLISSKIVQPCSSMKP